MFSLSQCDAVTKAKVSTLLVASSDTDISFAPDPTQTGTMICSLTVTLPWEKELLGGAAAVCTSHVEPPTPPRQCAPPRSLGWLLKLTDEILGSRLKYHQTEMVTLRNAVQRYRVHDPHCDEFSTFVFTFLTKKFGLDPIVRRMCEDLLSCIKVYRTIDIETQIFGLLLCSKKYDALDVLFYCMARTVAMTHAFAKVDALPGEGSLGSVTRRYIWEHHVPLILKQVCKDMPMSFARRCRSAVRRWHDVHGRLPGLVADPGFYTPPFLQDTHPYVGHCDDLAAADCGPYYLRTEKAMELHQLLMLLLINFHHDRMTSSSSSSGGKSSPARPRGALLMDEVPLEASTFLRAPEEDDDERRQPSHVDVYQGFETWLVEQHRAPAAAFHAPTPRAPLQPPAALTNEVTVSESILEKEIGALERRLREAGDDLRKMAGVGF